MSINTGGPAFPRPTSDTPGQTGMTLRDWFAGMALQGLVGGATLNTPDHLECTDAEYAEAAYSYADAMLKARNKETE